MTSIIVYTKPEVLKEKQGNAYWGYYWQLSGKPKHFEDHIDNLYVATNGFIKGYFSCCYIDNVEEGNKDTPLAVCFKGKDWRELKEPIPQKPFQGFKYFGKVI